MSGKGGKADTAAMYNELNRFQQCEEYEKAVKVCNKILNSSPKDETAFHCKMVNLLQLGKFRDALQQMDQQSALTDMVDLTFEKAYCLYKENRYTEALTVLEGGRSSNQLKHKELKAQIFYRMERYKECMSVYRDIIKNTSVGEDDFEFERMTNLAAVVVHLNAQGDTSQAIPESSAEEGRDESYEMIYNKACCLLANGEFERAEDLLKEAEKTCLDFLDRERGPEEEIDQEEVDQETGIIRAQRAYAIQKQGTVEREREAQSIYNSVLRSKPSDIGLVAVASNNLIAINKDQNIFDSRKKIKAATAEGLEHKLTSHHQSEIAKNNALLTMYTNQVDQCQALVRKLIDSDALTSEEGDMILAGALSRSGKTKEAIEFVLKGNKAKSDVERALIAAQIHLEKGDVREGLNVISGLPDGTKYRAGPLSAMVTLCLALNDRAAAADTLKKAVKHQQSRGSSSMSAVVWRKTAEFHLKDSDSEPSVAAQALEELLKMEPNNLATQAQLVLAYAKFDLAKALAVSKKLPKFSYQDTAVDIQALEDASFVSAKKVLKKGGLDGGGGPMSPKARGPMSPKAGESADSEAAKKKRKKKNKKKRLPKNLNVEPDPERWLPRRERTGYRKPKRNRRGKEEKFVGAQGSATGAADAFDYSQKKAASVEASPQPGKTADKAGQPGPRQQQRKPQPKKKSKGGKNRF